ncbi:MULTISPECIES: PTS sugar transporter subunit IIA [Oceanotoga]|uniref:PTS system nitrogen regulatory IIA component n=1 Tax=Oceanotoga teriensis TaxID=515440 RepID=A0AA45C566_9BACT|nr:MULTISPECIES: PTS sugar transporter subunit IIA [Oceanotoga]MDN5341900.1 fructose system component [Oceanotoga sp.]MDO7976589.1 PTS sugar transporter subunit IIA [Oceanotoga teriensis]PWJ88244.1 PTS system nitrogen regulatory IIA component [Oceanotoga teriensis]
MIEQMLKPEYIINDVEIPSKTKEDAIKKISEICSEKQPLNEKELSKSFLKREKIDSTGFGNHIAIPHAKIKKLKSPMISIIRFKEEINWNSIDEKPVKVAIALVMPYSDEQNMHLKIISKFARNLVNEDFLNKLIKEKDSKKLYKYIIEKLGE